MTQLYIALRHPAASTASLHLRDRLVPEAGDEVVVDHADGLHVSVDDGAADEFEAAPLEVLA